VYATGQAFHANDENVPYLRLAFGWIEREDIAPGVAALAECIRAATTLAVSGQQSAFSRGMGEAR
jgi:DNA-binding transcriptional MocR family regulator